MPRSWKARAAVAAVAALSVLELGSQSVQPTISITTIPAWGQDGSISGSVYGAGTQPLNLFLFVFIPDVGWTGLPDLCSPLTNTSGQFAVNATPNVIYRAATRYSAYLTPTSVVPNCTTGSSTIPFAIQRNAVASVTYARIPQYQTLTFGGLEWYIKDAPVQVSPGPQFFLQSNAFVDSAGQLHLRISPCGGSWCAAEVFTKQAVGYGSYRFTIGSQLSSLDPNITLGLFSWDGQAGDQYNREWDIEFGRWGNPGAAANAQFVVQPYNGPNNMLRFQMTPSTPSTHMVTWSPGQVGFVSAGANGAAISQWSFTGSATPAPTPGDVHLHLNLYVASGHAPSVPVPQEVVIGAFQYAPASAQVGFPRGADNLNYQSRTYSVPLNSSGNCSATIDTDSPWLVISGSNVIPAGAPLQYTVSDNLGAPRSGNLILTSTSCTPTLGAQVLAVSQAALVCSPSFSRASTHFGFLQSFFSVAINGTAPPCTWTVTSSASWMRIQSGSSGAGDGTVQVTADPNLDSSLRGGVLQLSNGPIHSVYQDGAGTMLALSPVTAYSCNSPSAPFGVSWAASGNVELHLNSPTGPSAGQFAGSGTATINMTDGQTVFLVQPGGTTLASARASVTGANCTGPSIAPLGLVNAASYNANSLAPGSLATAFGANLSLGTAQASGTNYPTSLGGVSVMLAGQACPLWYVSAGQVNFAVPSNLAPGRYTLAIGSAASEVLITNVSPGIFTLKGDGTGVPLTTVTGVTNDGNQVPLPAYLCNSGGCAATPIALPDALTDLYIVLYGTGIRNYRSISAMVGQLPADVVYVGAQSQFPGLDQVNLHLKGPLGFSGAQSLRLQVDGAYSNSVTLQFQ